MMKRSLAALAALLIWSSAAMADFTFTQGTGPTAFSFTSTTGGTALCAAASTHCFASVPVNTAGAQLFASGNPGVVSNNGTFVTQSTVTQGTAASLNATVVGTGTFVTQSTVTQGTASSLLATVTQGPPGASPWLASIVGGGNTAAVKAGFGAPAAADTALVVGISPNSWDVGAGTSGGKTQRVILDSSQVAPNITTGSSAVATGSASSVAAFLFGFNGTTNDALQVDSAKNLKVASLGVLGTTGGWTPKLLNALTNTVASVKNSAAGQMGKAYCWNPNATVAYLVTFDAATTGAVTLGSTTPKQAYGIPPTTSAGYAVAVSGDQYASGIQVAATTTPTGSTAPGSNLDCNVSFN